MKKKLALILALVLALGLLCGCGNAKSASAMPSAAAGYAMADTAAAEYKTEAAYAPEAPMENGFYYAEKEDAYASQPQTANPASTLPENVKLIYTADIDMETTEFDAAQQGLDALVAEFGGYYESNSLSNYNTYRYGSYTIRLPAQNFKLFCSRLGDLCQINNKSINAQDVSEAYYDTESRLVTQQTKLARLQELLKQAENMEDIITLETAISDTELTIENLTGTLRKYDSLVNYSTVYLYLREVYKLTEVEEPAIGFGAKLAAAFRSGCSRFVDNLQDFLLGLARGWVGWLIFLVIVFIVIRLIVRGVRRRRSGERPEKAPRQRRIGKKASKKAAEKDQSDET